MNKEEIRLQYSGYVVFLARILSVVTGLAFQLMVARTTNAYEYDIWFNMRDILAYFTLLAAALPFWTMRYVARNRKGAVETGFLANLLISALATIMYLPLTPLILSVLNVSQEYLPLYLLVSAQIIELYSMQSLQASLQATRPQAIGYGLLIAEVCKVGLGYVLIVNYHQPLLGGLLGLSIGYFVQAIYYLKLLAGKFGSGIEWGYVKDWLKGSIGNIYNIVGIQLSTTVFIILFAYGGEGARGRYGLAAQVASVVTYSSYLAFALYPKLLSKESHRDITIAIRMVLMLAIPMTMGAISLADSYIIIMKSTYADAWPVLVVLAVDAFILTLISLFRWIIYGVERFDEKARISFKHLLRSRLFAAFTLPYVESAITIPTITYALQFHAQGALHAALFLSVLVSAGHLIGFFILFAIARKAVAIKFPTRKIGNYVVASGIMTIVLVAIPRLERIYITLIATAVGGLVYLTVLMALDEDARLLVKSILQRTRAIFTLTR